MINTIGILLLLEIIINYALDVSGFGDAVKQLIFKTLLFPKWPITVIEKPWFCSLCMTFWLGLVVLIWNGQFNLLMIAILCLMSYLSPIVADLIRLMRDLLIKMMEWLYRAFKL